MTVIAADRVIDGSGSDGPGWVRVSHGRVVERGSGVLSTARHRVDAIVPGFVDVHVHGACGLDFATVGSDPSLAIAWHASRGSTSLVASLATGTVDDTGLRLAELAPMVREGLLAGLHLEGPFLSEGRRGAHNPALLRAPSRPEIDRLLEAGDGTVRMITLAPELPGALEVIPALVAAGVRVAIGHTEASTDVVAQAVDRGASVVTHLFNGMPPLHHRSPGPVGVALSDARLSVELIGDGEHLDDRVIDLALRECAGRALLVSDAMAAAGLGDGAYTLAGSPVTVRDGLALTADGAIAGSTSSVSDAVNRLLARGADPALIVELTALAPSRALGMAVPPLAVGISGGRAAKL
ncbi:N-acetylglucosamine-6-phosphate deacetylase [Microbacterium stercoris]|uniref:Amidohydrolase family protein n=1 Tax=Microbacterium stercoris TaxID=2820289 RepID=A0A939QJ17_9MICO|nr:amidohydrolase family protein [Microbacterium stercoris]MBO3663783.1 amidohydrolase family protein [Microbacterium stercoris]